MDKYYEIIRLNFKMMFQYRKTFMISLLIHPFMLLINIALFRSIYTYSNVNSINGYNLQQITWYFTAVYFVMIFITNGTDRRLSYKILSGDLTVDLLRPVPIFRAELAASVAERLVGIAVEFVPGIVIFCLIFFPRFMTALSIVKFIIVVIFSFLIYFLCNYLVGLAAFYLKSTNSLSSIKYILLWFLGGYFIPLEFLPAWLNKILDFLPFKYVFYWPIQFFLNRDFTKGSMPLLKVIAIQMAWVLLLYALVKLFWKFAYKKYCAAGG